jgi:hypothetical protein
VLWAWIGTGSRSPSTASSGEVMSELYGPANVIN